MQLSAAKRSSKLFPVQGLPAITILFLIILLGRTW